MNSLIKVIAESLVNGIPAWLRGSLLTLSIVLAFAHFSGFTYENYVMAQEIGEIKNESILMSYRSAKDNNDFANTIVNEVHDITDSYGVALFGLEPEYIPKVIRVVSRDGSQKFEQVVKVGAKVHISSRLPNAYMQLREGLVHSENISNRHELMEVGVKAVIAHPVTYKGLTIGVLAIFLDKELQEFSLMELEELNGELRLACLSTSEEFYYNREK